MDGPSGNKTTINEDMRSLSLKDLMIVKMFLEKGTRENLFLETEKMSVKIVHTKINNLINDVYKRQQELVAKAETK
jgi:hypothetical protein